MLIKKKEIKLHHQDKITNDDRQSLINFAAVQGVIIKITKLKRKKNTLNNLEHSREKCPDRKDPLIQYIIAEHYLIQTRSYGH